MRAALFSMEWNEGSTSVWNGMRATIFSVEWDKYSSIQCGME